MIRLIALFAVCLSLSGCCTWLCPNKCPRCWENTTAYPFAISDSALPTGGDSLRTSIQRDNVDVCTEYKKKGKTLRPADWAFQCSDEFRIRVLTEYCAKQAVPAYCASRCKDDSSCTGGGQKTLVRLCGLATVAQFQELYPYCAGLRLDGETFLPPPEAQKPRCE
jgi:hypothetical protein